MISYFTLHGTNHYLIDSTHELKFSKGILEDMEIAHTNFLQRRNQSAGCIVTPLHMGS